MRPSDFPLLLNGLDDPRRRRAFEDAVAQIAAGIAEGAIRNVAFAEARRTLDYVIEKAWDREVGEPYFHAGRYEAQGKAVNELHWQLNIHLHTLSAAAKRLAATKATGPAVEAMRTFVTQVQPLGEAVRALRSKVVKGRAPRPEPPPANPDKVVKTCPCCFRAIAVVSGHMAHHGYERPGTGYQTESCPGIRFPPLEVSPAGLDWLIETRKGQQENLERLLNTAPTLPCLTVTRYVSSAARARGETGIKIIKRGEPEFDAALRGWVGERESELAMLARELARLEARRAAWQPEAADAP